MKRILVKRILSLSVCFLLMLCLALVMAGCNGQDTPEVTQGETTAVTQPATTGEVQDTEATSSAEAVTDAPETTVETTSETAGDISQETASETEAATDDGLWHPDMGTFNEGRVTYAKEVETEITKLFPDAELGKPASSTDNRVKKIFTDSFSGDDPLCEGRAVSMNTGLIGVKDGQLYLPYDSTLDDLANDGWTTWSPTAGASFDTYKQVQLSAVWEINSKDDGAWMTAMWGCYVSNYGSKIPDNPGDGLWIAFQKQASKLTVYHPDDSTWPAGWADIPVEQGLLDGQHKVDIVCMPDYTTYVYVKPASGGDSRLIATVVFEDGKIKAYDEEKNMIKEDDCTTDALQGENFTLFVHGGGGAKVDTVHVLGCSKGEVIEHPHITATPAEGQTLGLDITDRTDLVSICYSVWFDAILGNGTEPVTEWANITEALAGEREWGPVHAFHYWAKPAQGYYRSSDKTAICNNMTMLYEAGVDFIVIDLTNAGDGYIGASAWTSYVQKPMDAMLDTIMEMRVEGKGTPYVVFWCGDSEGPLYQALYDNYHAVEKWKDCFVYWDGKPLLITTHKTVEEFPLKDLFTTRAMWGLNDNHSTNHWSFLNINNHGTVSKDANGVPEQVSVAVAAQETYMSYPSAHGRNGGVFWYTQWYYAFDVHPKIVGLTWWNEWTAQRFVTDVSEYSFVDNYTQEYSRDIEPMEGGHGDQYYQWLKQYISYYKAGMECPLLVEEGYERKAELALRVAKRNAYKP